ncbi:arsenate reductase (glutaredoxin) [Maricaulaceae bacterium NA33B04]|nr:arsenate reductase (glutaredoxin) [Maricaulaceae bacterium NA33B04]
MEFWHNPRCSKSREALALLSQKGIEPTVREYLKDAPSETELRDLIAKLGLASARDLMRTGEADYKDQGLKAVIDEAVLITAMAHTPKLIERPVLINGEKAAIGRPPETVLKVV